MDYPIYINLTSSLPILGLSNGIFIFIQIVKEHSVSEHWRPWSDAVLRSVESDLDLHCLYMSHKNDARLMG